MHRVDEVRRPPGFLTWRRLAWFTYEDGSFRRILSFELGRQQVMAQLGAAYE